MAQNKCGEVRPENLDMTRTLMILSNCCGEPLFGQDLKDPNGDEKLADFKTRLHMMKNLRNKVSHGRQIDSNEVYLFIANVKYVLNCFKGQNEADNPVSGRKEARMLSIERMRLQSLETLVREE